MEDREGRGVVLYLLLDVATDGEAREIAERLGQVVAEVEERVVGYSIGEVEPVALTFEEAGDEVPPAPGGGRRR